MISQPSLDSVSEVMEAVQFYFDLDLTVIPVCRPQGSGCNVHMACKSPGKVPVIKEWTRVFRSEKADKRIVEIFQQHDWDLNVGLLCGAEHNLYVVDIDGDEGAFSLACENALGELAETTVVLTGRVGGYHYWYRPRADEPPMAKKINFLKKVDFVAGGGFVLAPPSVHKNGNSYRFSDDCDPSVDPVELPEWTRDLIEHSGRQSNVLLLPLSDDSRVQIGQRALTFLDQGAVDGQREEAVNAVVNLLGRNVDRDEVVLRVSHALCDLSPQQDPNWPWTEDDVEKMVQSFERQGGPKAAISLAVDPVLDVADSHEAVDSPSLRARDIWDALKDTDVEESIVDGLMWPLSCHCIYATSGTGKTLLTLELLLHIAAGRPWQGREVKKSKVLLCEIDDTYQLRGYMETMRDTYGFTREELGGNFVTNREDDQEFSLKTEKDRIALQAFVQAHNPKVVCLDHLEGFLTGDGNYGAAVYKQLRRFKDWCKEKRIALWIIDHSLKGWLPAGEDGQPKNHIEALAGGQQKLAVFDVMYHMYGQLEDGPVKIWYAKLRGEKPDPLLWSFNADGSQVKAVIKDNNPFSGMVPKDVKVVEYIANKGQVSTTEILTDCGISRATFHRMLQSRLLPRELVRKVKQGGQGKGEETIYGPGTYYVARSPRIDVS